MTDPYDLRFRVLNTHKAYDSKVDPSKPDTDKDGNGYLDGWSGVYNVSYDRGIEYTDNVVLYRENLRSGDGIEGEEIIPNQAGVHEVDASEVGSSADVRADSKREHSNIHIGELHWEEFDPSQSGDPTDQDVTPDPSLTVEVDYHESVNGTGVLDQLELAEKTYALYGIDIEYVLDEEVNNITDRTNDPRGPEETIELEVVRPLTALQNEDQNHNRPDTAYMYITSDGGGERNMIGNFNWTSDPNGVASCNGDDAKCKIPFRGQLNWGIVILYDDIRNPGGNMSLHATKTMIHETGHLLGAGRNDDGSIAGVVPEEIYSGGSGDSTPEEIGYSGPESDEWSIMSSGFNDPIDSQPMNGNYVAFSIEEVLTVEFNEVETVD